MRAMHLAGMRLGLVCGLGISLMAGAANAESVSPMLQSVAAQIQLPSTAPKLRGVAAEARATSTACTDDTIQFGQARATGLRSLSINNATSAEAAGQWHDAPGPVSISGATFYAFLLAAGPPVQATVSIFLAGPDLLPTGVALATSTIMVGNELGGGTLEELAQEVSFASPVAVAAPFVIVVSNPSATGIGLISNDYLAVPADGQGDDLGSVSISGTWINGSGITVGGTPFDADWLIEPTVSYELEASFDATPSCLVAAGDVDFANSTDFALNRFYNQAVIVGLPEQSFEWDFGDGSAPVNAVSPTHSYAGTGPYTVNLTATVFRWSGTTCSATTSTTLVPEVAADFTWTENELQVSFTDSSNSADSWIWTFGDGSTSTLQNPTHTYAVADTYNVCLQVSNDCSTDTFCQAVSPVSNPIVTPSASAGGSITPSSPQSVPSGETIDFTLAADTDFYLSDVLGDCGGNLVGDTFTTAPITVDCTVEAQFTAKVASATVINPSANPVRTGQQVSFEVAVSGVSAPPDGLVTVTASTGESCNDAAPPQINGNTASFDCPITFVTLGPRTLQANFSGSVTHLDSSSAPLDFSVVRFADLSVAISDGQGTINPSQEVTYQVEVRNGGPDDAPGSSLILASAPSLQSTSWTCTAVGPAACPAASGSGELGETIDLPAGGGLDFVQNGTATSPLVSSLSVGVDISASAAAPDFVFDPQSGNNQASDVNPTELLFENGFEDQ